MSLYKWNCHGSYSLHILWTALLYLIWWYDFCQLSFFKNFFCSNCMQLKTALNNAGFHIGASLNYHWPNCHWPNRHCGQTVTVAKLSLAKLSLQPKCHWPKCLSGQTVSGQSVTGQSVTLAKASFWPNCPGQSVSHISNRGFQSILILKAFYQT